MNTVNTRLNLLERVVHLCSPHVQIVVKLILVLVCLYFFICSLSFLATSFRLLGGKSTGKVFSQSDLLKVTPQN